MTKMSKNKWRINARIPVYRSGCLHFILCLLFAPSAWGDYQDGRKAYNQGDYKTALEELRPLAEQGDAGAQYLLGYMYYKGQGVNKNGAEAVKWLRMAAEQGEIKSQVRLGVMFCLGSGVSKNHSEAEKWLRKAAEQGDAKARYNLGVMYYKGEGVDKDDTEGLKWLRKAAEQGQPMAQFALGDLYVIGELGVSKDIVEGHKWLRLAAAQDHKKAREKRDEIAQQMTPEQLAEAERRAHEWEWKKIEKSSK